MLVCCTHTNHLVLLRKARSAPKGLVYGRIRKKFYKSPKSHYTAPACGFQIAKIFQLGFFTNDSARPRHNWGFTASRELKRVKRISAFYSLALLQHRNQLN